MLDNKRRGYIARRRRPTQFSLEFQRPVPSLHLTTPTGSSKSQIQFTEGSQKRFLPLDVFGTSFRLKKSRPTCQTKSSRRAIFSRLCSCFLVKERRSSKAQERSTWEIPVPSHLRERRRCYGDKSTETDTKGFDTKACQTLDWHGQPFDRATVDYTNVNSCQPHKFGDLELQIGGQTVPEDMKCEKKEVIGAPRSFSQNVRITCPTLRYDYGEDFSDEDGSDDHECVGGDENYLPPALRLADGCLYRDDHGQGYIRIDGENDGEDEEDAGDEETPQPDFHRLHNPRVSQDFFSHDYLAERSNYMRHRVMNDNLLRYDSWGTSSSQQDFRYGSVAPGRTLLHSDNFHPPPIKQPSYPATRQKGIPLTPRNTSYCRGRNLHLPTAQTSVYHYESIPVLRFSTPSQKISGRCLLAHRGT
ncbi:unnamed protein product [Schistocephalus solidus]|uniref:Protein CASC3 n=1 Tax=Schistocephalus solidus TaxID=70667 RepID=A0A183TKD4_SCHSO|nr:unnamed protein product [Schistocephalus solidus]